MSTPDIPAVLGTYQVVRPLADTPIGRTLLGADATGRAVVLTLVDPGIATTAGFRERFAAEARAAAAAPLWFVAPVVDVDAAADRPWRAEVHVAGPTLQRFVDERGPLGDAGTAVLAERLAAGLAALHAGGTAHGDLTPAAVVLAEDGPRLVGLGLVRAAGPEYGSPGFQAPEQAAPRPASGAATTQTGPPPAAGSDSVRAPDATWPATSHEVPAGPGGVGPGSAGSAGVGPVGVGPVSAGSAGVGPGGPGDVFALGCVLTFAATGRAPFAAATAPQMRWRAAEDAPDLAGIVEPVRSAVFACLSKDPAQRPTAAQVAAMLAPPADQPTDQPTALLPGGPAPRGVPAPPPTLVGLPPSVAPHRPGPQQGHLPPIQSQAGAPAAGGRSARGATRPSRPARGRLTALLAVTAVVLVAAVVGAVALTTRGTPTAPAAPPAATAGPTALPTGTPASGVVDPGTGATLVDVTPFGADGPRFTTPSRNISCELTDTSSTSDGDARCDVAQHTWTLPPKPADCTGSWGGGASVSGAEQGRLTCASDTVADPGLRVLAYGKAVSFGGIVCDSQETGVRCTNRATGHGFRVARGSYDLF